MSVIVLPSPHVVGQAAAEPERGHLGQPAQPGQLVVAQGGGEGRGLLHRFGQQPATQLVEGGAGGDLDLLLLDQRRAGESGAEGLDAGERLHLTVGGLAGRLGVDQHPLVAQPYDRAVRLGQPVHLGGGQRVVTERQVPVEAEQPAGLAVDHRPRAHAAHQLARPVHVDAGGPARQQVGDLVVGELQLVGHLGVEQPFQRRPPPGRPAQLDQGLDLRPRPEAGVAALPQVGGVDDHRGVGQAVQLHDRAEPLVVGAGALHAQRQPYAGVGRPLAQLGRLHRLGGGEGGHADGPHRAGGTRHPVGDRVEEGAHQPFGVGEQQHPVERDRPRRGGHRVGQLPDLGHVGGVQRPRAPGGEVAGGHPRPDAPPGDQLEGQQRHRAPESGGRMGAVVAPGLAQRRDRLIDRNAGDPRLAQSLGLGDGDPLTAFWVQEGHGAHPGRVARFEDGRVPKEFPHSRTAYRTL